MYNYVLYSVRQGIFSGNYLKEYEFSTKLGRENQFDFRNLPTDLSQQVVGQVFKSIRSWVKLKKDFDKNPSKYGNHRPHIPSYKKGKKQNMVVFTTNSCRIKVGKLLNADINGAIGIGRKVFGDFYVSKIIDSGFAFNPVRVSIL